MSKKTRDQKRKDPDATIRARVPIPGKRSQEYVQHKDGRIERRCYAPHNPHYYQDETGEMRPIEVSFKKAGKDSKGKNITLFDKNVASVGLKKGKKKYLGIRPDFNQKLNKESLEFDLESVQFDGVDVDLDSEDLSFIMTRQRCRQLVPVTRPISSFRIEFKLYAKGLRVEHNKELDEFWFYSVDDGAFRFRIRKPVLTDGSGSLHDFGTGSDHSHLTSHSLQDNGDGSFTYIKESTPGFANATLPESDLWIDADTYYSNSSDGSISLNRAGFSWSTTRSHTGTYASVDDTDPDEATAMMGGYSTSSLRYYISRSFMLFDTSGASSPASVSLFVRGYNYAEKDATVQQGTQGTSLSNSDYNNFSGSAWDSVSWSTGWNEFVFNGTGIAAVNTSGDTKVCLRQKDNDYDNVAPSTASTNYNRNGVYYAESSSDPYLSITESASAPTVTTSACSATTASQTTGNGNITATGGENATERGFCYMQGTSGDPTTANDTVADTGGSYGTGSFSKDITGLSSGTSYRVRAYAINGGGTGYGTTVTVLTKPAAPTGVSATDGTHADKVVVSWTKSTGATGYKVYEGANLLDTVGDVASYDDTAAAAPTITPGTTVATDGTQTAHVALSLSGASTNNGASRTYKVVAVNATGDSAESSTDTGYRGPGTLTYQWQRSAADSDASYGNISGATSSTHNDTAAPAGVITPGTAAATDGAHTDKVALSLSGQSVADGAGRYYKCVLNATGCTEQTSTANRGYRGTGSLTYQWQRSAADSDASYSNIAGGTTASYDDTGAPAGVITPGAAVATDGDHSDKVALSLSGTSVADGAGRYYKCVLSATGCSDQTSSVDRGYRGTGSLTYQWQRSAADSDASYSNLAGATTASHDDTDAPEPVITPGSAGATDGDHLTKVALSLSGTSIADGVGRYYKCVLNATGCAEQTATANRGYTGAASLTYQWQRSAADSDASYSNLAGATGSTFDDTTIPDHEGRYYKCVLNATGSTEQTTAVDRGYKTTYPTVTDLVASLIADVSALLTAEVTATGGGAVTAQGFVWNLTGTPTVADNVVPDEGAGLGVFSELVTGLTASTSIYCRAYVTNALGTSYSGEILFATAAPLAEGFPAYFVDNLLDDVDFDDVTSSSEDTYFPLENLANNEAAKVFRFESEASGYIEIDFGSEQNFDFVSLLNHSFSDTVTVTVKAGASADPSSVVMTLTHRDLDMFKYTLYSTSARYVRIAWTDSAGASVHSIGELKIGQVVVLSSQFSVGFVEKLDEGKLRRLTHKGVRDSFDLYSLDAREYEFENLSASQLAELTELHDAVGGDKYPFVWIPDIAEDEVLFVKKSGVHEKHNVDYAHYRYALTLREESKGVEVVA